MSDTVKRAFQQFSGQVEWLCDDARVDDARLAAAIARRWKGEDGEDGELRPAHRDALSRLALQLIARSATRSSLFLVSMPMRLEALARGEGTVKQLLADVERLELVPPLDANAEALGRLLVAVPPPGELCNLRGPELARVLSAARGALGSDAGRALIEAVTAEVAEKIAGAVADQAPLASAADLIARARRRLPDAATNASRTEISTELLDRSVKDAEAALKLEPSNVEALVLHARLLVIGGGADRRFQAGALEQAAADLARAEQLEPERVELWRAKAELANARRDFRGAAAAYSRVLELEPDDAASYALRGVMWLELGEVGAAEQDARAALKRAPRAAAALWVDGRVRSLRGDLDGALARFSEALEHDPNHAGSYLQRSITHLELGDLDRALADATRSVELSGDGTSFYNRGNLYLRLQRFDLAEDDYTRALERDPGDVQALLNRSVTRLHRQQLDGAIADLRLATQVAPNHPTPHMKLGLLFLPHDPVQGRAELELALQLAPADWPHRAAIEQTLAGAQ